MMRDGNSILRIVPNNDAEADNGLPDVEIFVPWQFESQVDFITRLLSIEE
jgi:hypothetical protein